MNECNYDPYKFTMKGCIRLIMKKKKSMHPSILYKTIAVSITKPELIIYNDRFNYINYRISYCT